MKTVLFSAVFWFFGLSATAQDPSSPALKASAPADTLPDLEVVAAGRAPLLRKAGGAAELKGKDAMRLARTLGEADFISHAKMMANVDSDGDYSSGISVEGADITQTQYLIDGSPVTFPYRFGGIFSVFSPAFFTSMRLEPHSPAWLPPRLGGALLFSSPSEMKPQLKGSVSAGLTASSAALHAGIKEKIAISAGGRISYVDQVYGRWLNKKGNALAFSFHDLNAALSFKPTPRDLLQASFFSSGDRVGYEDKDYSVDTRLHWTNQLFSLSYRRLQPLHYSLQLYHTRFANTLTLAMPQFALTGPSSLRTSGGRFQIGREPGGEVISEWEAGALIEHQTGLPQSAEMSMKGAQEEEEASRASRPIRQRMLTSTLFVEMTLRLIPDRLISRLGASTGYFASTTGGDPYRKLFFSPQLRLSWLLPEGEASLFAGLASQPLHQVGFSELGLASNFWIGACREATVQRSLTISARLTQRLPWGGLSAEASAYWKKLRHQAEYQGAVMEVIDADYNPFAKLIIADGHNAGLSVGLHRAVGALTGSVSYSYSAGRRHLPSGKGDSWGALNAAGHSLKASLSWQDGRHWTLSAALKAASGRRYTPVKALYAIGNNVALEFGERNSARLPSYQRLDLSATYLLSAGRKHPLTHLLNFSLLNAYGHRNVEMQYFILSTDKGAYTLKRLYSLYRFLPSLSYTIEF